MSSKHPVRRRRWFPAITAAIAIALVALPSGGSLSATQAAFIDDVTATFDTATPWWATAVAAGQNHSVALHNQQPYGWGSNTYDELGNPTLDTRAFEPAPVLADDALAGRQIMELSSGKRHVVGLTDDGRILAWGDNTYGQLGTGDIDPRDEPVLLDYGRVAGRTFVKVVAGHWHTLALDDQGNLLGWGLNRFGQLGNNDSFGGTARAVPFPQVVRQNGALAGKTVIDIAGGDQHSLALTDDGRVYAWGYATQGQLGDGNTYDVEEHVTVPVEVDMSGVMNGRRIVAISGADFHSAALDDEGRVYTWGAHPGRGTTVLGDGTTAVTRWSPVDISQSGSLAGNRIVQIDAGSLQTIALDEHGRIHAWGENTYGEVGDGSMTPRTRPVLLSQKAFASVDAGNGHTLAFDTSGRFYAWGRNNTGQLGDGTTGDRPSPTAVRRGATSP